MEACASKSDLLETLRAAGITNSKILKAFEAVKRERFVPASEISHAYENRPIILKKGATVSQPLIIGIMLQALELQGTEKVLDIGSGSGYQAAILSHLAASVYGVELDPDLFATSSKLLKELHCNSVTLFCGDGHEGLKQHAPYDAIMVAAASKNVPPALIEQLAPGGKLILPLGERGEQEIVLITKTPKGLKNSFVCKASFVPLV